jgi:hypothetical protein
VRLSIRALLTAAVATCLAIACGPAPHDRALDIVSSNPTGHINGVEWAMAKATVRKSGGSTSADAGTVDGGSAGTLSVNLFSTQVADCATSDRDAGYIIFSMPAKVGKRELQLSLSDFFSPDNQTVTFVTPPSSNDISTDGILNLTELTDTQMTLGILAKAGKDTDVNGTFTATFCP